MTHVLARIIRHSVLANIMVVFTIVAGAYAGSKMLRETFPNITTDMLSIVVLYPGANVEEVEEGISRKIEEAIDGLEGIKRYTTISSEGTSRTVIEIVSGYPMPKARDAIENEIDAISTFPIDSEKPITTEILNRRSVLLLTLAGDMDERTRKELAEQIKDELQAIPGISQISLSGLREYEIIVEMSESRLRQFGLTFNRVARTLREGSVNLSGGSLRTKGEEINIRAEGRKYTAEDIGSIVLLAKSSGELITLDRVATVRDGFVEDPVIARFNGKPGVLITIEKTTEEDSIAIARLAQRYANEKQFTLPEGITLTAWADGSVVINDRLRITLRNGAIGVFIVFLLLWFFLDSRVSVWVAIGIPVSISGSLIIMWLWGLTLNSVTLFGLIMVTGIVVDDGIIIGEAIQLRRKMGDGPLLAAVNGVLEVGMPVIAAVCTTVVAFLPLAFISGMMGKFMYTMAIAVIGALLVSLVEALFVLPAHLSHLPDVKEVSPTRNPFRRLDRAMRGGTSNGLQWLIDEVYAPFVRHALRFRYVTLSAAASIVFITAGLVIGGFVTFVVFPNTDENLIQAGIEFPQGTPIEVTLAAVDRTTEALLDVEAQINVEIGKDIVDHLYTVVGEGVGGAPGRPATGGTHVGRVQVELAHSNTRGIHSEEILARWQERVGVIPGALSQSFGSVGGGGPGGAPIDIWIQGENTGVLRAVSEEIKEKLRTYDGLYQIEDSFRPGKREIKIDIKPEARTLGLSLEDVARQVYAGFYGEEAVRLQRGRDDVRVKVRYTDVERSTLANLEQVRIRTPEGNEVPFLSVAKVQFGAGPAVIERADGRRRISVSAQLNENVANAQEIVTDMRQNYFPDLLKAYPGFTYSFEGGQQQVRDSSNSLFLLFPIAMMGMYIIIATIFRSYLQPLVILATVPLGVIGAIYGHLIMGIPLVMFSVFGMMALTGVVVNDAIVLIEAVNNQIAKGVTILEAIARGAVRRFRAILLTTLSTVGALIPLIIETDLSSQPLKPMALTVASGVAFATLLTLIFIPCLLAVLNDFRRMAYYLRHDRWPSREEVEPARLRDAQLFED